MSGRPREKDEDARRLIREAIHENIMVEAAAGSGKTTILVDRILTMISAGINIEHIVAITFTRKAAEELKARLRRELNTRLRESSHDANLKAALHNLDNAMIGTIHSFCLQIIRAFSLAMRLSPAIEVMSGIEAREYTAGFRTRFREFLEANPELDALSDILQGAGLDKHHLVALANHLDERLGQLDDVRLAAAPVPDKPAIQALRDFCRCLWALDYSQVNKSNMTRDIKNYISGYLAWAEAAENELEASGRLLAFDTKLVGTNKGGALGTPSPRGNKWHLHLTECFFCDNFDVYVRELQDSYGQPLFVRQLEGICDFLRKERLARAASGRLTQSDLITLTLGFLRQIRQEEHAILHDRFRHFMIDEFQDTDGQQFELFLRVISKHAADKTDLEHLDIDPGSLFIVGDPKQAIYRFRGGDLTTYLQVKKDFTQRYRGLEPARTSLTVNFRTLPSILRFANIFFGDGSRGLISCRPMALVQSEYVDFDASNKMSGIEADVACSLPPLVLLNSPEFDEADTIRTGDLRNIEANDIAAYLAQSMQSGLTLPSQSGPKPLRYSDFAVLCPTHKQIEIIRRSLEALSIPYVVEVKTQVYQTSEIIAILSLLRGLSHPHFNQAATVTALRSQLFSHTDQALFEYRLWYREYCQQSALVDRDAFDFTNLPPVEADDSLAGDVLRSLLYCQRLADFARVNPVHLLLDKLLADCRQYQAFPEQIGTFSTLLQDALEFDVGGGSLDDYLVYTALLADDNQNKEIVYHDDDFDAVCITNFHQSKGREWPICIIAAAAQKYAARAGGANLDALIDSSAFAAIRAENPRNETFLQWPYGSTIAVKAGMLSTADYAPAESCENVILESELARLYYVALTRTKYSLVLTSHHSDKTRKSTFAGQLLNFPDCLEDFEHIESYCETDPYALRRKLNIAEEASASAQPKITLEQYRKIHRQQSLLSRARSSVAISKHDDDDASLGFKDIVPPIDYHQDIARYMETIDRRPEQPGQFGTAVHRALELCRLSLDVHEQQKTLDQAIDELSIQECDALGNPIDEAAGDGEFTSGFAALSPDYQLMLDTITTVVRDSPTIAAARKSSQVFFEMPLAALLGGKSIRAYSDLIFTNPDGTWTIADFKNATTPDSLTVYYRQLWAYKHIFEQATGERVTRLALIYCLGDSLDLVWDVGESS